MKKAIHFLGLFMALLLFSVSKAQMSGSYAIPGAFPSLAVAITSLNNVGVSGSVTIDIAAGYTETVTVGGFTLNSITGVSALNTIVFQKSGAGANPILYAYAGGTAVPSSAEQDGIWRFAGTDYVTIDGIDLNDPNAANPATMEFGYGFFRASATNGCQNNTIKNCRITLNRINNAAGAGPAADGCRGIDMVDAAVSTHTTPLTITAAGGANSNNKFYSNIIENCNIGIAIIGFADVSPFSFADTGNDIGGSSLSTGNTIINFGGGGSTSAAAGVRTLAQYAVSVRYNTVNSNNGSGIDHAQVLRGIYLNTATSANATVSNNTVTVKGGATTNSVIAIENASGATAASNTITIINNLVTNCTYSTATSGPFIGIFNNGATAAVLNISTNTLSNNSSAATSGNNYPIYNNAAVTGSILIVSNNINGFNYTAGSTSLTHRSIYNSAAGATAYLSINNNNVQAITFAGSPSGDFAAVYSSGAAFNHNINGNTFTNLTINTSGIAYLIYSSVSTPANGLKSVTSNSIITGFTRNSSGATFGYYNYATSAASVLEINLANNFSNMNISGSGALTIWQSADGSGTAPFGPTKSIALNTFTNITAGTGQIIGIFVGYSNSTITPVSSVFSNTLSLFTSSATIVGIYSDVGAHSIRGNAISSFTSSGATTAIVGLMINSGTDHTIYKNRIYDLQHNASDGGVAGIHIVAGTTNNIYNNLIGDLKAPTASGPNALLGINMIGGTTNSVSFNSIYLNGTSSGANFGSSAIFSDGTPGGIIMRNNVLVNLSTPTGTGLTVAYRRGTTSLVNYLNTSNNNLYYAGTPGTARLIFSDGTNNSQTLAAFKTLMATRDGLSVTENPPFVSTSGSNTNFLNISTSVPTLIESGALPVAGITDDYAGTTRNIATPDIGAWEGPFTIVSCSSANGGVLAASSATACAGQTLVAISNGVSTGVGTTYLWKVGATPGGPYVPVTGGTGSTSTSYTSAPLGAGIYYVVLQTSCAATGQVGVSNEGTLTVNALPTASASSSSATICAGSNLNLSGTGTALTFTWTGPNSFSTTSQNTVIASASPSISGTYTLIGSSAACTSTPSTLNVAVNPVPLPLALTPASASLCAGGSQTIVSAGGAANPTLNFGTQANQNTASVGSGGYPSPYTAYYGGQRMQMLITAGELLNAGFIANTPITSIQFPVVSKGANWGSSITENQAFQVNIGVTSLNSISSFQGGLTNVVAPSNFTPAVGYGNTHTFSTPFIWNGTSNIILETTFSNNFSGAAADLVVSYNSPTTFQSTIVYRNDSQTASTVAAATTVNFSYNARPDFKLNGISLGTFTWSPGTGLSATSGTSVVASPTTTTTYTLTSSLGSCSTNTNITINVTPPPSLTIAATATAVCAGDATTLTATGANTYSWNGTPSTNTISVSPSATTIYTVFGQSPNCSAVSKTISITSNSLPVVAAAASPTAICAGQSATLTASGADNYSWISGPLTSTYVVSPASNTTYSVTGTTTAGCSGQTTVNIVINAVPALTISPASATVCASAPVSFTASGASTYSWSSGSTTSVAVITSASSGTYLVTGTNTAGCFASQTASLTVNALPNVVISPASPTICVNETLTLTGSGASTYSWITGGAATTTISVSPATTTSYTLEGTSTDNCKNTRSVTVTVNPCTGLKEQKILDGNVSLHPNPSTGLFTASFGFEGKKEILVLNSVGALILKTSTEEQATSFNLSDYAKGVYFVRIKTSGASANYKVIVE